MYAFQKHLLAALDKCSKSLVLFVPENREGGTWRTEFICFRGLLTNGARGNGTTKPNTELNVPKGDYGRLKRTSYSRDDRLRPTGSFKSSC
jgi:hypothetical protein